MSKPTIVPVEAIEQRILLIRGQKVILDADLAQLYQVKTKALNQAVKRNIEKFPGDFMLQLTRSEAYTIMIQRGTSTLNRSQIVTGSKRNNNRKSHGLRSQIVTLKRGQHIKYLPYVFTEHGAIMAANVLKSERATQMSLYVVRAFVKLRETFATHKEFVQKLAELERKVGKHDTDIHSIVRAIRQLMAPPEKPKRPIGFRAE